GVGGVGGDSDRTLGGKRRELAHVPDGDAAAVAGEPRPAHNLVEVHPTGVEIKVEMEIDIEVEAPGEGKNAGNVLERLGVGVGATPDQVGTLLAGLFQQIL